MSRRLRTVLIGVAAIVIVAVVGAIVFIVPNMRDNDHPPASTTSPPTIAPEVPANSELNTGADGFGIPDADLSGRTVMIPNNPAGAPLPQRDPLEPRTECSNDGRPVSSPESVMIQRNFGLSTLYSETDGPSYLDGLVLAGYTRTPQGAALAAANVYPRLQAGGPVAVEAAEKLTLVDLSDYSEDEREADTQQPVNTEPVALRAPTAFRVLSCTDSFAVIELAMIRDIDDYGNRMPNPTYTGVRMNMVWDSGTWKVRENERAEFGPYMSLDGFTRWSL